MINTNNVLHAVTAMQQNAQAALPVIPNNGNPAGAYNMPQQSLPTQAGAQPQQQRGDYYYPWLAPSPHMETIRNNLMERQTRLNEMMTQYSPQPIAPQAPMPEAPAQMQMPPQPQGPQNVREAFMGMLGQPATQQPTQMPTQQLASPPVIPQQGTGAQQLPPVRMY